MKKSQFLIRELKLPGHSILESTQNQTNPDYQAATTRSKYDTLPRIISPPLTQRESNYNNRNYLGLLSTTQVEHDEKVNQSSLKHSSIHVTSHRLLPSILQRFPQEPDNKKSAIIIGSDHQSLSYDSKRHFNRGSKKFTKMFDQSPLEDTKINLLNKLAGQKHRVSIFQRRKDADSALKEMIEVMYSIVEMNDIEFFWRNLEILGDLSVSNTDFKNAIYCYNKMRQLGEYTNNLSLKVRALIQLSDTCKLLRKYDYSKKFLKKALQYVWYENKQDQETLIYDKLGIIHYLEGDMKKAKEYHERSVGFLFEEDSSVSKRYSNDSTRKYLKALSYITENINTMLLAKLGMITEKGEDIEGRSHQIKFFTGVDTDQQLENINLEEEFAVEIGSPSKPKNNKTKNGYIHEDLYQNFDEGIVKIHKNMQHKEFFMKRDTILKERVTMDIDLLKQDLDKRIKMRIQAKNLEQSSLELYKKNLLQLNTFGKMKAVQHNTDKMLYNHLTPNRNIVGFNFHFKPCGHKINKLFEDMVASQLKLKIY